MAFWLSSPLIDPPQLLITAGALGWDFAIGKALSAVGLGLLGGFAVSFFVKRGAFAEPLRHGTAMSCCGCSAKGLQALSRDYYTPHTHDTRHTEAPTLSHLHLSTLHLSYAAPRPRSHACPRWRMTVDGGRGVARLAASISTSAAESL